jgi:hypothetical protein
MAIRTTTAIGLGAALLGVFAACNDGASTADPGRVSQFDDPRADAGSAAGDDAGLPSVSVPATAEPQSITVSCGAPRAELSFGVRKTIPCTATGVLPDGSTIDVTHEARWSVDDLTVAFISGATGEVIAHGTKGGRVVVSAARGTLSAVTNLDLDMMVSRNAASVSATDLATLRTGSAAAANVTWAYPYDKTVFPRGLPAPELMWNGGPSAAAIYVKLEASHARLESVVRPSRAGKALLDDTDWHAFEESAEGPVTVTVKALVGSGAYVLASHRWTMAPGNLRGSVYYWAANVGRVLRLKPGRSAPEDFSAGAVAASTSCTTTCHTVSANGSTFLSGGDGLGGTYDLRTDRVSRDVGGQAGSNAKRRFAYGGVSADGRFVTESFAPFPVGFADASGSGGQGGLFYANNLQKVPNSGLDGIKLGTPSFAADDRMIAFVDYYASGSQSANNGQLKVLDWDSSVPRASGLRTIMTKGSGQPIHFPSMSPDHALVGYHRGGIRTDGGNKGDLYAAFTAPGSQQEVRLAAANGDGTALPGGTRDANWNFEPTFAPRASGGYFWAVFTSRRVYGNELTGPASEVKQLWVTAIDVNARPGQDPSHPAFRLPGQAGNSLNLRGFWALDPCKSDGQSCGDGSECCGGFCNASGDAGALSCSSVPSSCSRDGDRCTTAADCCSAGASCIANTCSAPAPR